MAIGIPFPEANDILRAPAGAAPGSVYDLHIHRYRDAAGNPHVISKWQFQPAELALVVAAGGAFWFHAWGVTHPPVAVEGENPFVRAGQGGDGQELPAGLFVAARDAILNDLRDRRLLKYLFADDPDSRAAYGYVEEPIDLETQREIADALVSAVLGAVLAVKSPAAEPNCFHCGDSGEIFSHADNCESDSCALNGDIDSCLGKVERCGCTEAEEHPNAQGYRNRAERAEAECAELRAVLATVDRDARPENWDDEPGAHADAWRLLDKALGK